MSLKVNTFQEFLGNPLNVHNFVCTIPVMEDVQLLVTSTTFPRERMRNYTLHFQGERVKFPSLPTNDGVWRCQMPEGEMMLLRNSYIKHFRTMYTQKDGTFHFWSSRDKFDIEIFARTMNGDVDGSEKLFGVKLHGCFFGGADDVSLDASAAETHWVWNLNFHYDWMEEIESQTTPPTY